MDAQGYESASDANLDCCCKICCTLTCRMREVDLRKCTVLLKLEYLYHLFIHTSSSLEEKKRSLIKYLSWTRFCVSCFAIVKATVVFSFDAVN